jgi:glycosyltransferase involved in cell wall biosynthesis
VKKKSVAILIPVKNEVQAIPSLISDLTNVFGNSEYKYKIFILDDNSVDKTFELLSSLEKMDSCIKYVRFRRSVGKSNLLRIGLKQIQKDKFDFICFMDGDGQDRPDELYRLLNFKDQNSQLDLISGERKHRQDKKIKIISSRLFNSFISIIFKVKLKDINSGIKVMNSESANFLVDIMYRNMHRFIPIFLILNNFTIQELEVRHNPRLTGKSKYGSLKFFMAIFDLFIIFLFFKYRNRLGVFLFRIGTFILALNIILFILKSQLGLSSSFNYLLLILSFQSYLMAISTEFTLLSLKR